MGGCSHWCVISVQLNIYFWLLQFVLKLSGPRWLELTGSPAAMVPSRPVDDVRTRCGGEDDSWGRQGDSQRSQGTQDDGQCGNKDVDVELRCWSQKAWCSVAAGEAERFGCHGVCGQQERRSQTTGPSCASDSHPPTTGRRDKGVSLAPCVCACTCHMFINRI